MYICSRYNSRQLYKWRRLLIHCQLEIKNLPISWISSQMQLPMTDPPTIELQTRHSDVGG